MRPIELFDAKPCGECEACDQEAATAFVCFFDRFVGKPSDADHLELARRVLARPEAEYKIAQLCASCAATATAHTGAAAVVTMQRKVIDFSAELENIARVLNAKCVRVTVAPEGRFDIHVDKGTTFEVRALSDLVFTTKAAV